MKFIKKTDSKGLNEIVDLVNAAYRGTGGEKRWTTEAHLVQGDRLAIEDLEREIATGSTEFYLSFIEEKLVGCIGLKHFGQITEFGTFAVDPNLHGYGYGKELLNFAETVARTNSKTFQVTVVSQTEICFSFTCAVVIKKPGIGWPIPKTRTLANPESPILTCPF